MAVESTRCPACGEHLHGEAPCSPRSLPEIEILAGGPCNCLPTAQTDWVECAHCGLPQRPGKAFCGFCGHRWVTAETA
jgi:hypothetical protein